MGVYYDLGDHAGLGARLSILAIDGLVLFAMFMALGAVDSVVSLPFGEGTWWLLAGWGYLAGLKATRSGTAGYRALGVRLVDLQGKRASLWQATMRALFLFFGPINVAVDLLWLTHDHHRQTLRDKVTGTYLIRVDARPAGRGPITYPSYFVAAMSFVVPEVSRPAAPGQGDARG